jgi:hypothetical protein
VLADFLGVQARVGFRSIQPCLLGQAFVRFNTYNDRDQLTQNSPHALGDVFISFTEHDRGRNHRVVTLNHEVWLMLLGSNLDFWSDAHVGGVSENLDMIPEHVKERETNTFKHNKDARGDSESPADCSSFQSCESPYTCPHAPLL